MKCVCPKCEAFIETHEQEVSSKGDSQRCPECNEKYWTQREEFMLRAYKKQGRIYCIDCGHELGCETLCMHCGSLCPDYCIVQSSKPVVRKQKKAGFSFNLGRRSKPAVQTIIRKEAPEQSEEASDQKTNKKWLAYAAIAVMAVVLVGGMTKVYLNHKADQLYSKKFITTLYGIKSGTDLSLGIMADLSSEWGKTVKITNIAPRSSPEKLDKIKLVKTKINKALGSLGESPEKFTKAKNDLIKLHKIYEKIYVLNTSTPGSLDTFSASTRKLEAEFLKTASELKSTMPEVLQEELETSVTKYRNLKFML